jgi:TldD protein
MEIEEESLENYFCSLVHYNDFGNLTIYNSKMTSITLDDSNVIHISKIDDQGFSVEIEKNGIWTFGYSSVISKDEMVHVVSKLYEKLSSINYRLPYKLENIEVNKVYPKAPVKNDPRSISDNQKIDLVKTAMNAFSDIKPASIKISYTDMTSSRVLFNTAGSEVYSTESYPALNINLSVKLNERKFLFNKFIGGNSGFGIFNISKIQEYGNELKHKLYEIKKDLGTIVPDKYDIVLDSYATATLAHEIIGHLSEAAIGDNQSRILKKGIGSVIGAKCLTVVDDPTILEHNGSFLYDQEGIKAQKKILIENGIRVDYLHSLETASIFGVKSNGSARAVNYKTRPIPRMSNLYISGGEYGDDIMADIKRGVILYGSNGGSIDPSTGNFRLFPSYGQVIQNGRLGQYINVTSMFGNAFDILNNIDAIGKEVELHSTLCLKNGAFSHVAAGGPKIRIRGVMLNG